jgi:hypothetical protein
LRRSAAVFHFVTFLPIIVYRCNMIEYALPKKYYA